MSKMNAPHSGGGGEDWFEPLWRVVEDCAYRDPALIVLVGKVKAGVLSREQAITSIVMERIYALA